MPGAKHPVPPPGPLRAELSRALLTGIRRRGAEAVGLLAVGLARLALAAVALAVLSALAPCFAVFPLAAISAFLALNG